MIPNLLREHPRFVVWKKEPRFAGETPTKLPFDAKTSRRASSTDSTTWTTYDIATATLARHLERFAGIGFCFGDDAPFIGIDLDDCRDSITEIIEPRAQQIVDSLGTYAEVSPSGCGVKLIGIGTMPTFDGAGKNYRKNPWESGAGGIEFYRRGRFFTLTGNHVVGTPTTIEDCTEPLASLYRELYPPMTAPLPARHPRRMVDDSTVRRCAAYLAKVPVSE